jgi:hypothetical protein
MGERRRRPTLPKQRRVGVARHPMKVPLLINHLDRRAAGRACQSSRHCTSCYGSGSGE